jgi:endonuclease/exonuclease/phosphatase family metal-dependent hydrolase
MPPFPRPKWDADFPIDVAKELTALRAHAEERGVPQRSPDRLLLATWNIANLGVQKRDDPKDYVLLAEIVSWFDIVAVQEVNDNLAGLRALMAKLPGHYRTLFSEASGNQERVAFVYDTRIVQQLEKVGRLSIPPADLKNIKLPGSTVAFEGFDRGPYMAAFAAGAFRFLLVSVHLYFGSDAKEDMARRALETIAVARWADKRRTSKNAYVSDIIALGDFNLPKLADDDPIYKALTSRGLQLPDEEARRISQIGGTSLGGLNHYDQIAIFPAATTELQRIDVFDFERPMFRDVFAQKTLVQFLAYTRFHMSDHRPLWAQFKL